MTPDEEAAVRYAAGFIAMKLKKQFIKKDSSKAGQFVECLSHMAIDGEGSSFFEYTQAWVKRVNRGGLFELSDTAYLFFKAVEVQTQNILPQRLKRSSAIEKEVVFEAIVSDENVQIFWEQLSVDIYEEEESQELLLEIVKLWVSVRGYSVASFWVEQYKIANREALKKKKALRKELKEKTDKK